MYEEELVRVGKKITKLFSQNYFVKKNIYVFGVSDSSRQIINMLRTHGVEPIAVIDNDISKQGSYCARKPVISIDSIADLTNKDNLFIVYSAYWREMIGQFKAAAVSDKNILLLYKRRKSLFSHIIEAFIGKREYEKIVKKYNTKNVFLCPYTGTGDIYLIGTFWKAYCETRAINDYVFIVISGACKKAAMLCEINNIELLQNQRFSPYIISAHMLWPDEVRLKVLNDSWAQIHTNQIEWFRGYKGLKFTDLFRRYVFDLTNDVKPQHPKFMLANDEIKQLMMKNELIEAKTVILSPYSNTLSDLPDEFWKRLAAMLLERGFCVCTNSSGITEPAIMGTKPIFFPLTIAPQFIEAAGTFIGVRSGFCDIVSGAKAKKIILYDKNNRFYMGSAYSYFNLDDMELCEDAVEIELSMNDLEMALDKILRYVGENNNESRLTNHVETERNDKFLQKI